MLESRTGEDVEADMGVRVASLLEIKNILLVGMNLRLVEEADPLYLGVVLDIVLRQYKVDVNNDDDTTSTPHFCKLTFFHIPLSAR